MSQKTDIFLKSWTKLYEEKTVFDLSNLEKGDPHFQKKIGKFKI